MGVLDRRPVDPALSDDERKEFLAELGCSHARE